MSTDRGSIGLPYVVVSPHGVVWLGHAKDAAGAWTVALGWPSADEINERESQGWYAATATVSWEKPGATKAEAPAAQDHIADASKMIDVEAMLQACLPGGSFCDPQRVADDIREWFAAGDTNV